MPGYTCVISETDKTIAEKSGLFCVSCRNILRDPVQIACGHRYCRSCVEALLSFPPYKCLVDKLEFKREEIFKDSFAQREILLLLVHCNGCDWRGELRKLEDHEAQCPYVKVQCMHPSCGFLVPRDDLPRHLTECIFRQVQCHMCKLVTSADKLKQHQETNCQEYAVDCPTFSVVKVPRKQEEISPVQLNPMRRRVALSTNLHKISRNILLLKPEDVTTRNGEVYTPILMKLSELRKSEQFKKGVVFSDNMSGNDVRSRLEEAFPELINKRFSCAARENKDSGKLVFHGNRRVWNGTTIRKKLRGASAMYIVLEDEISEMPGPATVTCGGTTGAAVSGNATITDAVPPDLRDVNPGRFEMDWKDLIAVMEEDVKKSEQINNMDSRRSETSQITPQFAVIQEQNKPCQVHAAAAQGSERSETGYSSAGSLSHDQGLDQSQENGLIIDVNRSPLRPHMVHRSVLAATSCESSQTGYSSEEGSSSQDQEFVVTINPNSGPPEGGKSFCLEFDKSLPYSVVKAWAYFGDSRTKVFKTYEEDFTMFGKNIPPGKPGPITVTITTETGSYLGETIYTYGDTRKKTNEQSLPSKRKREDFYHLVHEIAKAFKQFEKGDDSEENETLDSQQRRPNQEKELQPQEILKPLVYAAAEEGAMELIKIIFSLSAGRIVFEAYKNDSPLPEDIAEDNGHKEVAAYLKGITKRYSEEGSASQGQSKVIDWLELANAFEKIVLEPSGPSSNKDLRQIWEDDISETGYSGDGETSSSGSEKESSESDDEYKRNIVCKAGDVPGQTVTVIITKPDGNKVGRTQFTYVDKFESTYKAILKSKEWSSFFEEFERQNTTQEHEGQQQSVKILQRLIYTAARIGEEKFIRLVFGTSVGRTAFEAYKNKFPLPEDIADVNGHAKIASYFRGITERFSKDDGTSQTQSKVVNWLELVRAESELQPASSTGPSEANIEELQKDDTSETAYFGDTETPFSNSDEEICDSDDQLKTVSFKDSVGEEDEKTLTKCEILLRKSACDNEGESASSGCLPKQKRFTLEDDQVPPEIPARGLVALKTYNKALSSGRTILKRVPIMLIGKDRSGKTSLKKALKGICFDPAEDSTVGIDVDPSHFKVSTETWRTEVKDLDQNSETTSTFVNQTARCIVDRLKTERKSTEVNTTTEERPSSFDSEITKMEGDPRRSDPSRGSENVQTTEDSPTTSSGQTPHVSSDPTERNQEDVSLSYRDVPDEVSSKAQTLLQRDLEDNEEEIYSILWDFGGQSVYHVTHPVFLTERAIYCLVYDLSLNPQDKAKPVVKQGVYEESQKRFNLETNMDYLDFWMESRASLARSQEEGPSLEERKQNKSKKLPPVLLVCTHADTPYGGRDPKDLARKIFGSLKREPYGVHLFGVFSVDNTSLRINNSECPEVQRLRKEVFAVAKALPHIKEAIPIKWLKFEKELQAVKEKGRKHISLEAARDIAENVCSIDEEIEFEILMTYLHDLRSLIHFDNTAMLNKLVVLDPQWLVDVFKKVMTVKPFDRIDMEFLELWCKLEEKGILDEELLVHVWDPLLNNKETSESLIGIMEKFSLLYPLRSDTSRTKECTKKYLVLSMLKSNPSKKVLELVESAQIPSLFLIFPNGLVPAGFFPRLVLQFLLWGNKKFWRPVNPQLFHNFARFFTNIDGYSVILMCHSSSVEVVVHGGDLSPKPSGDLSLNADFTNDTTGVTCARVMRRRLGLMLESMRNEFPWLKNMKYKMSVICPACCKGRAVDYCKTHSKEECKQEQCLHFLTLSELCYSRKGSFICSKSAFAKNIKVQVEQFSPWFSSLGEQELCPSTSTGTTKEAAVHGDPENSAKALNVILLAGEWVSSMGGLSTITRELTIALAKHTQVKVTLLVPQFACGEEDKRTAESHNIAIREAQRRPGFDDPLHWLSFPPKDLAIDIVLRHSAKLGKQAQIIRDFRNDCKWAQVVHTAPGEVGMHTDYPGAIAKGRKKSRAEVDLCKLADRVVTVGPKLTEAYSSYLWSCMKRQDIIQLTPGIFHEFTTVEQAAGEGSKFKVVTFGRGDSEDFSLKGYDIAAKAVTELKDSSYRLVFVGAPSGKEEEVQCNLLQGGISRNQLIVRRFVQSKERLKELFCEVDLVIMPYTTEGFGLTALEALSAGLPILVSGNSGFAHALRDLAFGKSFVVDSKDPKEWAQAIASIRQKRRAQRLKEIATLRTCYEERYSWRISVEPLLRRCGVWPWGLVAEISLEKNCNGMHKELMCYCSSAHPQVFVHKHKPRDRASHQEFGLFEEK